MEFNEKLRLLRKTTGYTQKKFAEALDSAEISIRNYEAGRKNPNGAFLHKLCNKFPEHVIWLMTGEEHEMEPSDHDELLSKLSNEHIASLFAKKDLINYQHPGEILFYLLDKNKITVERFSKDTFMDQDLVEKILESKTSINADIALRLGKYFRSSAWYWLDKQFSYDLVNNTIENYLEIRPFQAEL
jgi:antitoxin HigA-1